MANTFKSAGASSVGTSATIVYTAPASTTTTVIGLSCANTLTSSVILVDVYVTKGGTDYYLVKKSPVATGGALVVVGGDQKLVLETGNTLKVKSNTATSVDVFVSVLELT